MSPIEGKIISNIMLDNKMLPIHLSALLTQMQFLDDYSYITQRYWEGHHH